jgi:hypothetical protein
MIERKLDYLQGYRKIRAEVFEKGLSDKLKAFKQSCQNETLNASNLGS